MKNRLFRLFTIAALVLIVVNFIVPEDLFAGRRGGSFGGFRSSRGFGGSRSSRSFGGSRSKSTSPSSNRSTYSSSNRKTSSFGGTRMTSASARQKYGTPRKVENYSSKGANGVSKNYQINDYGGYSSSLMRGYMTGHIMSSMMWTPWHGAFWYSRPVYINNPDGTVAVYPPTFDYSKLFTFVLVIAGIMYVVYVIRRKKKVYSDSSSSFD